jgi:hypothetical protein
VGFAARARVVLLLAAVTMASCGGPRYHYVKHDADNLFFKVPSAWKLFTQDTILESQGLTADQRSRAHEQGWVVAFDSSPSPSIGHVLNARTEHPWGMVRTRLLGAEERDSYSLIDLRRELISIDPLTEADQLASQGAKLDVLDGAEVRRHGGLHGVDLVFQLTAPDAKTNKLVRLTVHEVALLDANTTKVRLLAVGCGSTCYDANKKQLDAIVESWTVKER